MGWWTGPAWGWFVRSPLAGPHSSPSHHSELHFAVLTVLSLARLVELSGAIVLFSDRMGPSLLLVAAAFGLAVAASERCPPKCMCSKTTLRCMFLPIERVPHIPRNTTIL